MLESIKLENVLMLDVETVPGVPHFSELDGAMQALWEQKVGRLRPEEETPEDFYFNNAGIYAEFGRIVCISVGAFAQARPDARPELRIKSFASDDEKAVLLEFAELLNNYYSHPRHHYLAGHNLKEFDVPYICRRMLVNGIPLPGIIDIAGAKPWEVRHLDTLHLWRFGDYKNYTSLHLLATILGIPTPKDDIEGKDVGRVYWREKDLSRIVSYCQKDVLTVAQLLLRYKYLPLLGEGQVTFTT